MNKSELVRKTAKIAGAPEAEASLFFEIFIRSAADILSPGDIIQIKDIGFLHYKVAKANSKDPVRDFKSAFPGTGWIDLIIYSESPEKINAEDPVYFVVPGKYELDFAEIDAPFSLSINKPVIQQIQKREAFFLPQSYGELIRLLESKAARLLVTAKVIKNDNKQNEVFIPGTAMIEHESVYSLETESDIEAKDVIKEPEIISPEKPEEKDEKEKEPQIKSAPGEENKIISEGEEYVDLKKEPEQGSFDEEKNEKIMSGETNYERIRELKEEPREPAVEEKNKTEAVPETVKAEEPAIEEVKPEQLPGEKEKVEQPESEIKEAEAEIPAKQKINKDEKTPSDQETAIDKLLSKGSFGANIPWKFDEISVIEPGRREQPQEEYSEEANEEQPAEKEPEKEEKEGDILPGVEQAEEKIVETPAEGEIITGENVQQPEKIEPEAPPHEIYDENLNLGSPVQEESVSADKTEVPEMEEKFQKPAEEPETKPGFQEPVGLEQIGKGADETGSGTPAAEPSGEGKETPFQRIDFSDTEGMVVPEENIPEPEEKNPEQGAEAPGETSELPSEDKDYEVIKPVKLKYDWREGFLKETDEPSVPGELKEKEEKEKTETPDEEGYIEIKPGVSKDKIDFLADTEEEILKEEKIIPDEDQAQKDLKEYISKIEEIDKETSHKRRNTTILAVIVFLLFVGIGVFLYYQYIFKKSSLVPGKKMTVVVKHAKTIERDFEIPVNYPYSKNENKSALFTQPIDSSIIAASRLSTKKVSALQTGENKNAVVPSEPPKLENLGDYIFRQGNDYIVQIASFETQTRAEAQVSNLKKANYDSYIRVVQRPDGSTYYAVMIKGFKSYDEAKNFLK